MTTDGHVDPRLPRSKNNTTHIVEVMSAGVSQRVINQKQSVHARIVAAFQKTGQSQENGKLTDTDSVLASVAIDR